MRYLYSIIFSKNADKLLDKLDDSIRQRMFSSLNKLRENPERFLTKLVGEDIYKYRIGDYRIFVDILPEKLVILVIKIGHRKNVYDFNKFIC